MRCAPVRTRAPRSWPSASPWSPYNVLAVVQAAMEAPTAADARSATAPVPLSMYHVAHAVREHDRGMLIAVAAAVWAAYDRQHPAHLAETLREVAAHVRREAFRKHPRGPTRARKKGYAPRKDVQQHVATARLLQDAKRRRSP